MKAAGSVACAVGMCALIACSRRTDFERMRQQARVAPYSASTIYSDGLAMRIPPAGTVAFGSREGEVDDATGQHDFETHCRVCHGSDGRGDAVMASNMPGNRPPSLVSGDALTRTDMELLDVVTKGKNRMPPFAWSLSEQARVDVVAYVRDLQRSASVPDGVSLR